MLSTGEIALCIITGLNLLISMVTVHRLVTRLPFLVTHPLDDQPGPEMPDKTTEVGRIDDDPWL